MDRRDSRVIWEVAKLQMEPWRRMVSDFVAGLKLVISSPARLKGHAFWFRQLWRHSPETSDRWYRCHDCGRLWHVMFGGCYGLPDDGDPRRTQGECRWCSAKRKAADAQSLVPNPHAS